MGIVFSNSLFFVHMGRSEGLSTNGQQMGAYQEVDTHAKPGACDCYCESLHVCLASSPYDSRKVRHNAKVGAEIAVQLAAVASHPPPSRRTQPAAHSGGASSKRAAEGRHRPSSPPRVAVFGGAVADTVSKPPNGTALIPGTSTPGVTRQSFGGVGRNVAEGVARVLRARLGGMGAAGGSLSGVDSGGGADVTLVSVVGADDAGKALVAGCEEAGVMAEATVEVGGSGRDQAGTASYVAMLDGETVVAVVAGGVVADVLCLQVLNRS